MAKRRNKFWNVLFVSVLLTLTIALGACAGDKESGESPQVDTTTESGTSQITIGIPQDLDSLDPNISVASGTQEILYNVYEGLYKPDSDGNLVPAVASDCTVSEDGKIYTFTLREGIKFHNGNAVTVEDVVYSMNKCAGDGSGEPLVSAFSNVEKVEATDDKTVEITLTEANKDFLAILSATETCIVRKM